MIEKGNVEKTFDIFWDNVRNGARKNLKTLGKGGGRLDRRMFDVTKEFKNSFLSEFFIEDYGKFVDKGVKGVGGTRADGKPWRKKRVTNSEYSYKDKRPPAKAFDRWSIRRGLAPRTGGGLFTSRKGLQHALSQTIYHEGIETTNFLTDPFNKYWKTLPQEVEQAYALDAERFFDTAVK